MGMLREKLRRANVRLIAVNEYYAKDISKKIKSTFKTKGESGKHVASSLPYGYRKPRAVSVEQGERAR